MRKDFYDERVVIATEAGRRVGRSIRRMVIDGRMITFVRRHELTHARINGMLGIDSVSVSICAFPKAGGCGSGGCTTVIGDFKPLNYLLANVAHCAFDLFNSLVFHDFERLVDTISTYSDKLFSSLKGKRFGKDSASSETPDEAIGTSFDFLMGECPFKGRVKTSIFRPMRGSV